MIYLGINIGGTHSNGVVGELRQGELNILRLGMNHQTRNYTPEALIGQICDELRYLIDELGIERESVQAVGISCGSPLDSRKGVILSPPNLPGWDEIPVVSWVEEFFDVPVFLANDANAGALAEWHYGAGKDTEHMIFLTFGTGMGAGIIADGRLIRGASDGAGEIGHVRMERFGPVGYGKQGSFEGFCSGSGIAQLAKARLREELQQGIMPELLRERKIDEIDAEVVARAAATGDPLALEVIQISAKYLGQGLAILIDVLNPELIVLGSIYMRNEGLFSERMWSVIEAETLSYTRKSVRIVPALLDEQIGPMSALSVAVYYSAERKTYASV